MSSQRASLSGLLCVGLAVHGCVGAPLEGGETSASHEAVIIPVTSFPGAGALGRAFVTRARVPDDYPTIQRAVDAVVYGGVVTVGAGVYTESVRVRGKRVTIEGRDITATTLRAPSAGVPAVEFTLGGGGVLRGMMIEGGSVGVEGGEGFFTASPVALDRVFVQGSQRGVEGRFEALSMTSSFVTDTAGDGVHAAVARELRLSSTTVQRAGRHGVSVSALDASSSCSVAIDHLTSSDHGGFGLRVAGKACRASIADSAFVNDAFAGVALYDAGETEIRSVQVVGTRPSPAGLFGDGLFIWSTQTSVIDSAFDGNGRAGISIFGCDESVDLIDPRAPRHLPLNEHPASLYIRTSLMRCNPVDVDIESADATTGRSCGGRPTLDTDSPSEVPPLVGTLCSHGPQCNVDADSQLGICRAETSTMAPVVAPTR